MTEENETQYEIIVVNPITGTKEVFAGTKMEDIKTEIDSRFGPE